LFIGAHVTAAELALKPSTKVMMMGQPEAVVQQVQQEALAAPEIQDDFDIGEGQAAGRRP
jgi:hypothetical protein